MKWMKWAAKIKIVLIPFIGMKKSTIDKEIEEGRAIIEQSSLNNSSLSKQNTEVDGIPSLGEVFTDK